MQVHTSLEQHLLCTLFLFLLVLICFWSHFTSSTQAQKPTVWNATQEKKKKKKEKNPHNVHIIITNPTPTPQQNPWRKNSTRLNRSIFNIFHSPIPVVMELIFHKVICDWLTSTVFDAWVWGAGRHRPRPTGPWAFKCGFVGMKAMSGWEVYLLCTLGKGPTYWPSIRVVPLSCMIYTGGHVGSAEGSAH